MHIQTKPNNNFNDHRLDVKKQDDRFDQDQETETEKRAKQVLDRLAALQLVNVRSKTDVWFLSFLFSFSTFFCFLLFHIMELKRELNKFLIV